MRRPIAILLILSMLAVLCAAGEIPGDPLVGAKSAILVDERSGKVLWERDADARRFPASTTKVLTALLLIEHCRPEDRIAAPLGVEDVEGSSLHLKAGERISARDLLYGLMVRSANDGAFATALHISGTVPGFARLMNERAARIGCKDSNFVNPHGLHDPNHYTTARDLSLIAMEAMRDPIFRESAKTRKVQIERTMNLEDRWLISKNRFLGVDPSVDGIKTGYTNDAGNCFVGSTVRNGFRVISVVMASETWKEDHRAMVDWAYKYFTRSSVARPGQSIGTASVEGGAKPEVGLEATADAYYAHRRGIPPKLQVRLVLARKLEAPIRRGTPLGDAVMTDGAGWDFRMPVRAAEDVPAASLMAGLARHPVSFGAIGGLLLFGAIAMRSRTRRLVYHGFPSSK